MSFEIAHELQSVLKWDKEDDLYLALLTLAP